MNRAVLVLIFLLGLLAGGGFAEHSNAAWAQSPGKVQRKAPPVTAPAAASDLPPERIEADVSTRTIAVTSGYSGAEILVFGTIDNSRQPSPESGFYDVVVVVEGAPESLMVRKKGRVAGLWVNTSTFNFNAVPSYYAVASTRPVEEFADAAILDENGIGLDAVRMAAAADSAVRVSSEDLIDYKAAVTRLKQKAKLFKRDDYGVIFTGRSLFRATIGLPATVPVGPLTARVFLFHEGKLLSRYQSRWCWSVRALSGGSTPLRSKGLSFTASSPWRWRSSRDCWRPPHSGGV